MPTAVKLSLRVRVPELFLQCAMCFVTLLRRARLPNSFGLAASAMSLIFSTQNRRVVESFSTYVAAVQSEITTHAVTA